MLHYSNKYCSGIDSGHAKHIRLNFAVSGGMSPRPLHFSCGVVGLIKAEMHTVIRIYLLVLRRPKRVGLAAA